MIDYYFSRKNPEHDNVIIQWILLNANNEELNRFFNLLTENNPELSLYVMKQVELFFPYLQKKTILKKVVCVPAKAIITLCLTDYIISC